MNINTIPITEAKAKLPELVRLAGDNVVTMLLRHGRPAALVVGVAQYDALLDQIEDLKDRLSVYEAREHPDDVVDWDRATVELLTGDTPNAGKLDA